MGRTKLEGMTKEQLQSRAEQLEHEIETLKNVIEASNTTVFDLLIGEVKKEMQDNIAEEEWKKLKENQKKIESYRSIEKTLQNQEDLLERKEEELEDVHSAIDCYQRTLFEEQYMPIEGKCEATGYKDAQGLDIECGDVFQHTEENEAPVYYLVKKSTERDDSFAFISNIHEGEYLLNYPKNREHITDAEYVGNIFLSEAEQSAEELQNALAALNIIVESQEKE